VLGIAVFNFLLLQLAPGDAADVLAGEAGGASPEYIAQMKARFGLDQPVPVQLGRYLANVATLDLGHSFRHNMPVAQLIGSRLPATLLLMVAAIGVAFTLGVLLGVTAARHVRKPIDGSSRRRAARVRDTRVLDRADADRSCSRCSSTGCRPAG
jgi:peptide/nickel transport system permease protein